MLCRTFTSVCWLAVLSLFLWPRSLPAQEKIRVGLSSISATPAASGSPRKKDYSKNTASTRSHHYRRRRSRVVSSLIAGEIQFSVGGGDRLIRVDIARRGYRLVASPSKGLQR